MKRTDGRPDILRTHYHEQPEAPRRYVCASGFIVSSRSHEAQVEAMRAHNKWMASSARAIEKRMERP